MTKRNLYEFAIKLMGLISLLKFIERTPELMQTVILSGASFGAHGLSVVFVCALLALMAIIFIIKGTAVADYLIRDDKQNGQVQPSAISSEDLLLVAVKVMGLYCAIIGLIEMKLFLLVIGCALVFGAKHVVIPLRDNHFSRAMARVGSTLIPGETQQSTLTLQDLLVVSVKVMGLYFIFNALLEMRLSFFIAGCIVVLGTNHIAALLGDEKIANVMAQLEKSLKSKEGEYRNSSSRRQEAQDITARPSPMKVDPTGQEATHTITPEQNRYDSPVGKTAETGSFQRSALAIHPQNNQEITVPERQMNADGPRPAASHRSSSEQNPPSGVSDSKTDHNRKKTGFFAEIFGKPR